MLFTMWSWLLSFHVSVFAFIRLYGASHSLAIYSFRTSWSTEHVPRGIVGARHTYGHATEEAWPERLESEAQLMASPSERPWKRRSTQFP